MTPRTLGVVMNGVTGRMGYRQHLVRSVLAINEQGGVALADGSRVMLKPVLVGRNADKLAEIAAEHGIADWTTDLDAALADDGQPHLLRRPGHPGQGEGRAQGHRGGQAHLRREADRRDRSARRSRWPEAAEPPRA